MRAKKSVVVFMLGVLVAGSAAPLFAYAGRAPANSQAMDSSSKRLAAELDFAVSSAERAAGGIAKSARVDDARTNPHWVIGVETREGIRDVSVERSSGAIRTTILIPKDETSAADVANDRPSIPVMGDPSKPAIGGGS